MIYDPQKHKRRSIRVDWYDYSSPGAYFLTICTFNKKQFLGRIDNGQMILSRWGKVIGEEWERNAIIRDEITLDMFIIMPNHIHGIVYIPDSGKAYRKTEKTAKNNNNQISGKNIGKKGILKGPKPKSIGSLVGGFKSAVTTRINKLQKTTGFKVWQRNYYEHIIRDMDDLYNIREYIHNNPGQWQFDRENPEAKIVNPEHGRNEQWRV